MRSQHRGFSFQIAILVVCLQVVAIHSLRAQEFGTAEPGDSPAMTAEPLKFKTIPHVVFVNPPHEVHAHVDEDITVQFNTAMDLHSLMDAIKIKFIQIISMESDVYVAPKDKSGKEFVIFPKRPLGPDGGYSVKIDTTAKSIDGLNLRKKVVWNFFTSKYPCNEPSLTLNVTGRCTHHKADACGDFMEGGCDVGFLEGQTVVTFGKYIAEWESTNTAYVTETCQNYFKETVFSADSGTIEFPWGGPIPGQTALPGFTAALDDSFFRLPDLVSSAWAGEALPTGARLGGTFNCVATAHGACNMSVSVPYTYSCR